MKKFVIAALTATFLPFQSVRAEEKFAPRISSGLTILATGKNFAKALAIAELALKSNPNDTEALFLEAEYFRYSGQYAQAECAFRKLIAACEKQRIPKSRLSYYFTMYGYAVSAQSKHKDSLPISERAMSLNPKYVGAKALFIGNCINLKRFQSALSEIEVIEKTDPVLKKDLSILTYKITSLIGLKQFAESRKALAEAQKLYPKTDWSSYFLQISSGEGRFEEVEAHLAKQPPSAAKAHSYTALAEEYRKRRQTDKEIAALTNAINLKANDSNLHRMRGFLHLQKGNHKAAISDLTQSLKTCEPTAVSTLAEKLADEQVLVGAYKDAIENYKLTLKDKQLAKPETLHVKIAKSHLKLGRKKEAIAAYTQAINCKGSFDSLLGRANCCFETGAFASALNDVETYLKKNPRSGDALYLQARCLLAQKKYEAALGAINFAIKSYPEMPSYLRLRAEILRKLKRNSEADSDLEKAKKTLQDSDF